MADAVQIDYVNVAVFGVLAVVALWLWLKGPRTAGALGSNFVALAAHELRTPVAVIHAVIETLDRRGGEVATGQRTALEETLRAQTARLKVLVEQLLDLSRLDAHAVPIHPQTFTVRPRVEEIVAIAAGDRAVEVAVDVPAELEATVDPTAFDRILSNLVTNAVHYGRPPITVFAPQVDARLEVAVEDRGEGVPRSSSRRSSSASAAARHRDRAGRAPGSGWRSRSRTPRRTRAS